MPIRNEDIGIGNTVLESDEFPVFAPTNAKPDLYVEKKETDIPDKKAEITAIKNPDLDLINKQNFYLIDKQRIIQATTPAYRKFLKKAGYGDLDKCSGLYAGKSLLKIDSKVRSAATQTGLAIGADGDYFSGISQVDGRNIIEKMNYKLLTTCLMYKLFIPYLKDLFVQGDYDARITLDEMMNTKAEWLEDIILGESDQIRIPKYERLKNLILGSRKVKICSKEKRLSLHEHDEKEWFDIEDLNEFGYVKKLRKADLTKYGYAKKRPGQRGDYEYYFLSDGDVFSSRGDEMGVTRGWDFGLILRVSLGPRCIRNSLGIRLSKILYK